MPGVLNPGCFARAIRRSPVEESIGFPGGEWFLKEILQSTVSLLHNSSRSLCRLRNPSPPFRDLSPEIPSHLRGGIAIYSAWIESSTGGFSWKYPVQKEKMIPKRCVVKLMELFRRKLHESSLVSRLLSSMVKMSTVANLHSVC